jgi:glycosyltransferase involved in cell wall biosynthesis
MSKILMLLSNPFRPDPRVAREARSLVEWGHDITMLCWDRQVEYPEHEVSEGINILRVQNVRSTYGRGARQLLYLPRFWQIAIQHAKKSAPDVIHCHDLDTLYAGTQIKKLTGCRLVYDAHEEYPALMSLYLPSMLVSLLTWWERRMIRSADHIITASSILADKWANAGVYPVTTIGNYQPIETFYIPNKAERANSRKKLSIDESELLIVYIGGFTRNRLLLPLIEAVRGVSHTQVILWGDGHQRQAIQDAVKDIPAARYCGWLPPEQIAWMLAASDAVYYCLNPNYPGAIYNAPNTLSYAMAAGKPIIANDIGDLGRIVKATGCGILLLEEVTPPAIRQRLGEAGRKAAEEQYNWSKAEERLLQVYGELLDKTL